MHRLHEDGHYRDVQERVLYNNILGAIAAARISSTRTRWSPTSSLSVAWVSVLRGQHSASPVGHQGPDVFHQFGQDVLYLSHFVDSDVTLPEVGGTELRIRQQTDTRGTAMSH